MHARAVGAALAALLLTACGSSSESGSSEEKAGGKPDVRYFVTSDGQGLNRASAASYEAITKAQARTSQVACDRAGSKGYLAWRECWHELLDPLENALTSVGAEFRVLTSQDFPEPCITELERGGETFLGFAARVQALLDGIDSEKRPDQVKAMRSYGTTLTAISKGSAKPFQDATQACYSPKDLDSINAKPTPASPSASPTGD
jgi:hypothetical protein